MRWIYLLATAAWMVQGMPFVYAFLFSSCGVIRGTKTTNYALVLSATLAQESAAVTTNNKNEDKVPITLLSGFLGSGKTCTLQHLLENKNTLGVKIGVIVNHVAKINIDAKLVTATSDNGIVELQNGCACCSLADELLTSVHALLMNGNNNNNNKKKKHGRRALDAVVVELSGVADPMAYVLYLQQCKNTFSLWLLIILNALFFCEKTKQNKQQNQKQLEDCQGRWSPRHPNGRHCSSGYTH